MKSTVCSAHGVKMECFLGVGSVSMPGPFECNHFEFLGEFRDLRGEVFNGPESAVQ
jgi:hypothetical protein